MLQCDVAQRTCGREVGDGVSRGVLQDIVGHGDKGVFLSKHLAILADEGQAVHIGVHDDTEVVFPASHLIHDAGEVALQRFRVVCEVTIRLSIEYGVLHPKTVEEFGQDDTSHAVDGVHAYSEAGLAYGILVHEFEAQHIVDVFLVETVVTCVVPQVVHVGKGEVLLLCDAQHLVAVVLGEELPLLVEQL